MRVSGDGGREDLVFGFVQKVEDASEDGACENRAAFKDVPRRRHKIPGGAIVFLPAAVTASDFTARATAAHPVFSFFFPDPHLFL